MNAETEQPSRQEKLKILVVDDIPEQTFLLEDVLTDHGYFVLSAQNGENALQIAEHERIHLIITDAMMPKMDGFQLCKALKQNPATSLIPVILYSGDYIDDEDQELAKSIGAERYVVKMGGINPIISAVQEVLGHHHAEEEETAAEPSVDDRAFIERHYKLLVKKLEEKMNNLEEYSAQLVKTNTELKQSEARYRLLFEQAQILIFVFNGEGNQVLDVNSCAQQTLGYSLDEIIAMKTLPYADDESNDAISVSQKFSGEINVRTKEGKVICLEASTSIIEFENEHRLLLVAKDITEQKAMLEKLFHAEKLTLLGTIAAGIAHEVRNPLAGIKLNLQYLEMKYGDAFEDIEVIRLAVSGTQLIEKVIENTLNIARSAGPDVRAESINEITLQALNLLALNIHKKNIDLQVQYADELPEIKLDSKQILQVILNILRNAIEATPEEGTMTVTTFRKNYDNNNYVVLSIKDSGAGISDEYLKTAFELFKTTKTTGTGLGLALSKRIMNQHYGDIKIFKPREGGTEVQLLFQQIEHKQKGESWQREKS